MSDLKFSVSTGETTVTTAAKTVVTAGAAANQRLKLKNVKVFGKDTVNTDTPVKVELLTYTSITGGTAGAVVTSKDDGDMGETIQTTVAGNYSVEPTYTGAVVVETWEVHPQYGLAIFFPLGDEKKAKGGTGFALRLTAGQSITMAAVMGLEE